LAVTEISWLTETRPDEIEHFWKKNYSEIDTVEKKLMQLENSGYKIINHFTLPNECWESYFEPMKNKFKTFLKKWENKKQALDFVNETKIEMELFEKYSQYYGYEFYIAQNE